LEPGVVSEFNDLLKSSFDECFPDCWAQVKLFAVSHLLDPAKKGGCEYYALLCKDYGTDMPVFLQILSKIFTQKGAYADFAFFRS